MSITRTENFKEKITGFFKADNLTKKASLNAFASASDYFVRLIVGLIITPLMVNGLGTFLYGVWQIMNRLFTYISTIDGWASPLEFTLAKEQQLENPDQKRQYVGGSLITWAFFLTITGILGGLVAWFSPSWLKASPQFYGQIRIVALIFVISAGTSGLAFMPYAILRGQNQGYRRVGISILVIIFNGFITWLALYLKTGIIGVSIAYLVQDLIAGGMYFFICKKHISWFGAKRPSMELTKRFFNLSWWYLASDTVASFTISSDVIILGFLGSVSAVTPYTLTKYIPEILISLIAIMVIGIMPGLGGIIGTGDLKKAAQIRGEIFTFTWITITVMGTTTLLWNRFFIILWVGLDKYAGTLANFLIMLVVIQFVLIKTDASIIDLTLKIQKKVLFGAISVILAIVIGSILVKVFNLGVIGVCIGLVSGRMILSVAYPQNISRFLGIPFQSQLKALFRPAIVTLLLFGLAALFEKSAESIVVPGIKGWIVLAFGAILTASLVAVISFFVGLNSQQRKNVLARFKMLSTSR